MKHASFDDTLPARAASRRQRRFSGYQHGPKRVLDIAVLVVAAPVLLPLVAALWLLVRLDGGPGFFEHRRVGKDGDAFTCWKLRSMCPDAEARLKQHLATHPAAAREWASTYKLCDDPRITRIGRILRRTSFDELPQVWNVLRGEMSLVGPRPVPLPELAEYVGYEWAYFSCRPGITGLWQVSGRNSVSYAARVRMDVSYLFNLSLRTDLGILVRTFGVVLRRTGL